MNVGWPMAATDAILAAGWPLARRKSMEDSMLINRTVLSVGLFASALGLGMVLASSADARQTNRQQRAYVAPSKSRNTPPSNVVCWTPCGQPGSIVMGADPDPFIRSQILRDASGFFGGGDN
jgi:hypothetical protein